MSILDYFYLILIVLFSFLPIIFWGYLFSYFDSNNSNKLKFIIGIFSGILSTLPILYLPKLFSNISINEFNIFKILGEFSGFGDILNLFASTYFIVFLLSFIAFIALTLRFSREKLINYFKGFILFLIFSIGFSLLVYFIYLFFLIFSGLNFNISSGVSFEGIIFNSFLLVVFYYLIIGLIEELSKFFCFKYSKGFDLMDKNQVILYGIFVALGFSFLENILYFKSIFESGGLSKELLGVYFSRNIFSVFLHIICTTVFVYFFHIGYTKFKNILNIGFLKLILFGFIISILLHAIFDIMLTLNLSIVVLLYLIGGYFYITSLFYKDS